MQMKMNVYIDKVSDYQMVINALKQHQLDSFIIFKNVATVMILFFDKKIY